MIMQQMGRIFPLPRKKNLVNGTTSLWLVTAVIVITVLVFTACNRGASQSTASHGSQAQITDKEEGFDAGFDASYLLEGDLWFAAADIGLKVTYATRDILNQYENYVTYIDESTPVEPKIIFTSTNAIDLEFLAIRMEYNEAIGEFFLIEDASMASSIIRPDTPFVVNWLEAGSFPNRAVAFYDRNDVKRYFTISGNDSGEGSPVLLIERQASQQTSQHYSAQDLIHMWRSESGSHLLFFQSNTTFEFIADGSVRVYHVDADRIYNLIREGKWHLTNGNNLFIEGEKNLGGRTPAYNFTFTITDDTLTITDHIDASAVFRRLAYAG